MLKLLPILVSLLGLSALAYASKAPENPDKEISYLHAEIFIYKGQQYFHFMSRHEDPGVVIGELEVERLNKQLMTMDMYYLGKYKNFSFLTECLDMDEFGCSEVQLIIANQNDRQVDITCAFLVEQKDDKLWLKDAYVCDKDIEVNIENDNEE